MSDLLQPLQFEPAAPPEWDQARHVVNAYSGDTHVGNISWHQHEGMDPRIETLTTREGYRRQGVATQMFHHVNDQVGGNLQHGFDRTPDGYEFAKSMGDRTSFDMHFGGVAPVDWRDH